MKYTLLASTFLIGAALFSSNTQATTISVDFNNAADIALFNTQNNSSINYLATGGVGGSGAVSGFFINSVFAGQSFDFSALGTEITVSAFYQMGTLLNPGPGSNITFGELLLVPNANSYIFDDNVALSTINQTQNNVQVFGGTLQAGGGSYEFFAPQPVGIIQALNWYQMQVTFTNLGSTLGFETVMSDYGVTGETFVADVIRESYTTSDSNNITSDNSVYAGLQILGLLPGITFGDAQAVDNFSVVYSSPLIEASAPGVLGLFGFGSLFALRGRRKAS